MIEEMLNDRGDFLISFHRFSGTGWKNHYLAAINEVIKPEKILENIIESSWHYFEIEYLFGKDGLEYCFHIDDDGSTYLKLLNSKSKEDFETTRKWCEEIDSKAKGYSW